MTIRLRSPAEYYIKALIVHPDKYTNEEIAEKLADQKLIYYSPAFIERSRAKVKPPPEPFYPEDECHGPSYDYITTEAINGVFLPELPMKMAMEILKRPRVQEFVEALCVVNVPHHAIALYVTRTMRLHCTVESLFLYTHYFWNIDLLDSTELRIALSLGMDIAAADIPELKNRKGALKSAYYKDARKLAADLPHSPTSAILVQGQLGIPPSKQDLAMKIIELRNMATLRALEAAHQGSTNDSQRFLNFINGARMAEDLLQVAQNPEDLLGEQLQSIALRTSTQPMPSIHQLSDGRHTVDVTPIRDPDHDAEPAFDAPEGHQDGGR